MKNFSDGAGKAFACIILNKKLDYAVWAFTMKQHMTTAGLIKLITEGPGDDKALEKRADEAKSILLSTMGPSEIEKILHCTTAKEIWNFFVNAYGKNTSNEKLELISNLNSFKCGSPREVADMINKIIQTTGKLKNLGVTMDETMTISAVIKALPAGSYETFLENWNMLDIENQTQEKFISKLLDKTKALAIGQEEQALFAQNLQLRRQYNHHSGRQTESGNRAPDNNMQQSAYRAPLPNRYANRFQPRQQFGAQRFQQNGGRQSFHHTTQNLGAPLAAGAAQQSCNYCKKIGHWKQDCFKLKDRREVRTPTYNRATGESAHNPITFMAMEVEGEAHSRGADWIADSGCSHHMSPYREYLINYVPFEEARQIRIGDNSTLPAIGSGDIKTKAGLMTNVYYVPKLEANLFSLSQAADKGLEIKINSRTLEINLRDRQLIQGKRIGGTYMLDLQIEVPQFTALTATSIEGWHQRLAHLPKSLITKMMKENIVDGLKIVNSEENTCVDCKLNKCTRASHSNRSTPKATEAGQCLHADVVGPIRQSGYGGQRFVLVCRDEFSHFRLVACLKAKSEVPETMKLMISQSELHTGRPALCLATDNGTEFTSVRLTSFLQQRGVEHRLSASYVPQQNGTAERENRTLLEQTRTMLNASKMRSDLWPEAINCANYVHNRCISSNRNVTPFELWFGRKPNINNLKTFGQQASVLKPEHMRAKLDTRGILMNFVGYTDSFNTFKFYSPTDDRIIVSCDAAFLSEIGPIGTTNQREVGRSYADVVIQPTTARDRVNLHSSPIHLSAATEIQDDSFDFAVSKSDSSTGLQEDHTGEPSLLNQIDHQTSTPRASLNSASISTNAPPNIDIREESSNSLYSPNKAITGVQQHAESDQTQSMSQTQNGSSDSTSRYMLVNQNSQTESGGNLTNTPRLEGSETSSIEEPTIVASEPSNRAPRNITRPNYKLLAKGGWDLTAQVAQEDSPPTSFKEAMSRPDAAKWKRAFEEEMSSIISNQVFEVCERPNTNIVSSKWVCTHKETPDGGRKEKARLVARGFTQQHGVDYHSTFAPVVQMNLVRFMFAFAALANLNITQLDVKTAFLYGKLDETIFMEQPDGFKDGTNRVWRLKKSLYGLKQAPRARNTRFIEHLAKINLKPSQVDRCVLFKLNPLTIIAIYVDDAIIISETKEGADEIINHLRKEFTINIIKNDKFLGLQYKQTDKGIYLHQTEYIIGIIERYGMSKANSKKVPFEPCQKAGNQTPLKDNTTFREIIGALQYAAVQTRPDIAFCVGYLARKVLCPIELDQQILVQCIRYLIGTKEMGLFYQRRGEADLLAFTDADFAGDGLKSRSTTGFMAKLAGGPIAWKSSLQKMTVTSTTEAEYLALTTSIKSVIPIRILGIELGLFNKTNPTKLFCDNQGAVAIVADEASSQRTRHLGAHLNYAREAHDRGVVNVVHLRGEEQLADALTKPLAETKFVSNRNKFMYTLALVTMCLMGVAMTQDLDLGILGSSVTVVPTNHKVEIGTRRMLLSFKVTQHCMHLMELQKNNGEQGHARNTLQKLVKDCNAYRDQTYTPMLNKIRNFEFSEKKRIRRDVATVPSIQLEENEKATRQSESSFWASILFPQIKHTYERYHPNSAENAVWRHSGRLNNISKVLNNMHREFYKVHAINNRSIENTAMMMEMLNQTTSEQNKIFQLLPDLLRLTTQTFGEIQRDTDLLADLVSGFEKGELNIEAWKKLFFGADTDKLPKTYTEFTRVIRIISEPLKVKILVDQSMIDENAIIYKTITFKDWIDTKTYRYTRDVYFAMYNTTNGCSKYIREPETRLVYQSCETGNTTLPEPKFAWTQTNLDELGITEAEPTIVRSENTMIVQCYPLRIKTNEFNDTCHTSPYLIPINVSFTIAGYNHNFMHKEIEFDSNAIYMNASIPLLQNPWNDIFLKVGYNLQSMRNENEDILQLNFDSIRKTAMDHPIEVGGITVTSLILISVAIIALHYFCKKDPIVRAIETQVLCNMMDKGGNIPSAPSQIGSMPSVNICIGNSFGREEKRTRFEPHLDGYEEDKIRDERNRPLTPYQRNLVRSCRSLCSGNSIQWELDETIEASAPDSQAQGDVELCSLAPSGED